MSSKAKRLGYYGEMKCIKALADLGISANRQILSGSHKDFPGDVKLDNGLLIEVKNRKNIPAYLFEFANQGNADALALTQAGEEVIFVLTAKQFAKLVGKPVYSDATRVQLNKQEVLACETWADITGEVIEPKLI